MTGLSAPTMWPSSASRTPRLAKPDIRTAAGPRFQQREALLVFLMQPLSEGSKSLDSFTGEPGSTVNGAMNSAGRRFCLRVNSRSWPVMFSSGRAATDRAYGPFREQVEPPPRSRDATASC